MNAPPHTVAHCNGVVLLDDGSRVCLASLPTSSSSLVLPLLVGAGVMLGAFSLFAALLGSPDSSPALSLGLAVGLGIAVSGFMIVRRSKRTVAPSAPIPFLFIDRQSGRLLSADGRPLAPLDQVWSVRRLQLASSSPALHLVWHGGDIVVARGNPFTSSVDDIAYALARYGIREG